MASWAEMPRRRRRPPTHECPRCRRTFRAWKESDCPTCRPDRDDNASALADVLRARRLERRSNL